MKPWGRGRNLGRARNLERNIPQPPNPCSLLSQALRIGNPKAESQRRSSLYGLVTNILDGTSARAVYPELPAYVVPYGYPFYAQAREMPAVRQRLSEFGFGCLAWPELPELVAPGAPKHYRDLWVVNFLW